MAQLPARGAIRVDQQGDQVALNVFGVYAYLSLGEADDLIDALDSVVERLVDRLEGDDGS